MASLFRPGTTLDLDPEELILWFVFPPYEEPGRSMRNLKMMAAILTHKERTHSSLYLLRYELDVMTE